LVPEGNHLERLRSVTPTDKYRTPWGRALNYDDAGLRRGAAFSRSDNAPGTGISEYHVDGFAPRPAVHGIYDFSARHLLEEIRVAVREQAAELDARPS